MSIKSIELIFSCYHYSKLTGLSTGYSSYIGEPRPHSNSPNSPQLLPMMLENDCLHHHQINILQKHPIQINRFLKSQR